jgi:hypothetical protein
VRAGVAAGGFLADGRDRSGLRMQFGHMCASLAYGECGERRFGRVSDWDCEVNKPCDLGNGPSTLYLVATLCRVHSAVALCAFR